MARKTKCKGCYYRGTNAYNLSTCNFLLWTGEPRRKPQELCYKEKVFPYSKEKLTRKQFIEFLKERENK